MKLFKTVDEKLAEIGFTKEKEEIRNQLMKTELYIQYKIACKNEKDLYYKIEEIKKSIKRIK